MDTPLTETVLTVRFTPEQIEAIDAWIARADPPLPSREEAVRQLVSGRLGAHGPSTVLPDFVTGRDIV
ncbi:hypothetical protein [Sphingomonas nostoxanthinifaciens]|uniref:hypothetical protein n=1 Tax=Sphingomonas nostoxanthinifaciens TaxID=2872652 RepID=UPI001CC2160A|nr:hypothetical protein [Sphingomonas nostoxanthinifaciens]UAK25392.1 hypothetical protein K8P63_04215 [Sphingomonas nostoxanthinifaciens]